MTSSLIQKYDVIIIILMSRQLRKWEVFIISLFFDGLTQFDMGFFESSVMGGGIRAPHHNFVVIALVIMKFGTNVNLDVFYTMVTKKFVTSLLLRHYDVITCILADT